MKPIHRWKGTVKAAALPVAMALGLSACAGGLGTGVGTQVSFPDIEPLYTPSELRFAGAGRDLTVDVIGNPWRAIEPDATFGEEVATAMRGRHFGPDVNFTTLPGETARPGYRVVFAFNPDFPRLGRRICEATATQPSLPVSDSQGRIEAVASFCNGEFHYTTVKGSLPASAANDLDAMRALVGQMTVSLFPNPSFIQDRANDDEGAIFF